MHTEPGVLAPARPPLVIDAHTHMGPFRNFHIPEAEAEGLVRTMDAHQVDIAVVADHAGISADERLGNQRVLDATDRHPGRIYGYCCVNPNYPETFDPEMLDHPAMRGVKMHPELHGDYPLVGTGYRRAWQAAAARHMPVLVHTYFAGDRLEVIDRLAVEFDGATILLGHSGLDLGLDEVIDLVARRPNVYLDLCGVLVFNGMVERLAADVGSDRLVLGTDMPFNSGSLQLGALMYSSLPPDAVGRIAGSNAAALFGFETPGAPA